MNEKEKKELNEYLKDYTGYDLVDEFNTQIFVLDTKEFKNKVLLYYFRQKDEIDNLEQQNAELKEENIKLKQRTEYLLENKNIPFVIELKEENKRLKNNWNELRNWGKERIENANKYLSDSSNNWDEDTRGYMLARKFMLEETLSKMQELEEKEVE